MQGYPAWFTTVVLAHEHAHAWQADHCPDQSQDVMEGFASWVEWHVGQNLGKTASMQSFSLWTSLRALGA